MRPNIEYIKKLMSEKNWSNAKLALKAGVSKVTIGRVLSGKRGAGKHVIAGLIKAFPNEPINKLFFLD